MNSAGWILFVVIAVGGEGSGHIVTERFGPYGSKRGCLEAADVLRRPDAEAGPFRVGFKAFCIMSQ